MKTKIILLAIFCLAGFFRLYGINWDQDQHLHPDERFLTMVAGGISWPKNLGEYLDTAISPLNPHNRGFGFFVYGTFPVFLTKWVAESLGKGDYGNLTIVGRELSALVDLGTVMLVYLIAKQAISKSKFLISKKSPNTKSKLDQLEIRSIRNLPLLAMFLYSIMVLPIQLSHFYAVDTYLTFFITLSFYLLIRIITDNQGKAAAKNTTILYSNVVLLGISFGLALASKISAVLFIPIIGLGLLFFLFKRRNFRLFFVICCLLSVFCFITFRLIQPYAFANSNIFDITLNPKILDNWKQLSSFMKPDSGFPPSVQWFGIKPFLFPFASLILWGLGLPLGIISLVSVIYYMFLFCHSGLTRIYKKSGFWSHFAPQNDVDILVSLSLLWVLLLFIYQSSQPAPTIRYYQQIYPFLAIISGYFLYVILGSVSDSRIPSNSLRINDSGQARMTIRFVYLFICLLLVIWPISFMQIYNNPHSRVSASSWIYSNIPIGSTIATEHWDDGLPMTLDSQRISQLYKYVSLPLYDPDRPEKWSKIAKLLSESDYIALTSNRLWGSITKASKLFPQGSRYYHLLFDGSLGFEKIAEITSFPSLPLPLGNTCIYLMPPEEFYLKLKSDKEGVLRIDRCNLYEGINYKGIVIRDELAEETFTVYDHPKVMIFKKNRNLQPNELLNLVTQ